MGWLRDGGGILGCGEVLNQVQLLRVGPDVWRKRARGVQTERRELRQGGIYRRCGKCRESLFYLPAED